MSKELDEFYKSYSARIIAIDDTPSVEVMDGGKFKLLSIEEYEEMTNKIADLEAKLVEKEKEIAYMTKQAKKFNNESQKYYEDAYCNDFQNQDKISFALEQLEKVKSAFGLINSKLDKVETIKEYIHYIDHQINELKEMK